MEGYTTMSKTFIVNNIHLNYDFAQQGSVWHVTIIDSTGHKQKVFVDHVYYQAHTDCIFFQINGKPYKAYMYHQENSDMFLVRFAYKKSSISINQSSTHKKTSFSQINNSPIPQQSKLVPALKSPLAGRISKVLVQAAQHVKLGQPLLLIESMKMENEICAPCQTFIKTISIAEGDVVQQNQILIEFEREGEGNAKGEHEPKTVQNRGFGQRA